MNPLLEVEALAAQLRAGQPALFPTDTLPALAAVPEACDPIWQLKQRPPDKPLILMGADLEQLQALLAVPWRPEWLDQARRCWPGAVTLVLPLDGPLTQALHPGGTSLGLRVPASQAARALLRCSGPLATTSANRSGAPPALDAAQAAAAFPGVPLLAPVPWPGGSGQASQVLAWKEEPGPPGWQVLRAGSLAAPPPQGEGTQGSAGGG